MIKVNHKYHFFSLNRLISITHQVRRKIYLITILLLFLITNSFIYGQGINPTSLTLCEGESLFIQATGGISYSWTGPNGFTSTQSAAMVPIVDLNDGGTYTVTITDNLGGTTDLSATVTVIPSPTVTINSPLTPICNGSTINLTTTASNGVTYSWIGPNGFTSTDANPIIPNAGTTDQGGYTVVVTDPNGCTATEAIDISIVPTPDATASATSTTICEGEDINLSSNDLIYGNGSSFSWTGPNGFTSSNQNPIINNATTAASGNYTVTVTSPIFGCTDQATVSIIVNPNPIATASATNNNICEGEDINLNASGADIGGTYTWTGPNGFNSTDQNPNISGAIPAASGTYTVTVVNSNGCSNQTTLNVIVNPQPLVNATATNNIICEGEDIHLNATGSGAGGTYSWTGPNSFNSTDQNPNISGATIAASGTYTVTAETSAGCTNQGIVNITVNPNPTVTITNSNITLCAGGTINLQASGGGSYNWTGPTGFNSNQQNPTISNAGINSSGNYEVTITDGNGCTDQAIINVIVNPSPLSPIITTVSASCTEEGSASIDNYDPTLTYTINPNDGASVDASGNIINATPGTNYTIATTDGNGCNSNTTSFNINPILPTPNDPDILITPPTCTSNGTATINNYDNNNTYNFTPSGPTVGTGGVISGVTPGTSYTVTTTNSDGCTSGSAYFNIDPTLPPETPIITTTNASCSSPGSATIDNYDNTYTYTFSPNDGVSVDASAILSMPLQV